MGRVMTTRRILGIAAASAAMLLPALSAAQAAGPEFCEDYAHGAIIQVRGGLNNPRCVSGMQGARWSAEWRVHYNWCLGVGPREAEAERNIRTAFLRGCTAR